VRLGLLAWRAVLVGCFAKSVLLEKAKALSAALHCASLSFAWHPLGGAESLRESALSEVLQPSGKRVYTAK
jgi:hypothetical protein